MLVTKIYMRLLRSRTLWLLRIYKHLVPMGPRRLFANTQ